MSHFNCLYFTKPYVPDDISDPMDKPSQNIEMNSLTGCRCFHVTRVEFKCNLHWSKTETKARTGLSIFSSGFSFIEFIACRSGVEKWMEPVFGDVRVCCSWYVKPGSRPSTINIGGNVADRVRWVNKLDKTISGVELLAIDVTADSKLVFACFSSLVAPVVYSLASTKTGKWYFATCIIRQCKYI